MIRLTHLSMEVKQQLYEQSIMSTLDGKYIHGVKLTFVDWGPAYDSSYPNQTIKLFHMNLNSGNWSWFKDSPSESWKPNC
jgi:hypothetical protein